MNGTLGMAGSLKLVQMATRGPGFLWKLHNYTRPAFLRAWLGVYLVSPLARLFGIGTFHGRLDAVLTRANGEVVRFGLLSLRVVTTAFVDFVTDQLQTETSAFGDYKYHDCGTGTGAEAISDTGLGTPYGGARAVGTQTESSHNVYQSVGTVSFSGTFAITEHGLFNASSGATLMDRSVFTAINVVSGDSIQYSYSLTLTAGG